MSKKYSLDYIIRKDKMNDKGECPIVLRYTYNRKYYRIPLGYSVGVNDWDDSNRIPKTSFKGFKVIFGSMMELTRKLELLIDNEIVKFGTPPSNEKLKLLLKGNEDTHKSPDSLLLTPFIRSFIDKKKEDPQVRFATLSIYETTYQKWIDYEKTTSPFKINEFSYEDLERFQIALKNQGLMFSTVGKYIKTMKTFLNHITTNMNIPMDLSYKKVKVEREEENKFVVLNDYEVEVLRKSISYTRYEIGEEKVMLNEREKIIGRLFWFMCITGLNYIDMLNLRIQNIKVEQKQLELKGSDKKPDLIFQLVFYRQKSTKPIECVIPIQGHVFELLLSLLNPGAYRVLMMGDARVNPRYYSIKLDEVINKILKDPTRKTDNDYRIFPNIPNASFNLEIKDICEKLEFNESVSFQLKKKGQPKIYKKKFELITARTGRRTYITNCLKKGVRPDILMRTTGHLKMDTMKRYNKYTNKSIHEEFENKIFNNEA
jgi:hypothetical protein